MRLAIPSSDFWVPVESARPRPAPVAVPEPGFGDAPAAHSGWLLGLLTRAIAASWAPLCPNLVAEAERGLGRRD